MDGSRTEGDENIETEWARHASPLQQTTNLRIVVEDGHARPERGRPKRNREIWESNYYAVTVI